ncbi:Aminotransferase, DegT/DnrJ/EryC1/StrS family [Olavius sp. associated proteobacterium Delta 1]|nr:Aminotransferase, DegT/DnrJ/EryC1/StrS family [Olavius sp. associated proteobacterium Delta 1]
MDISFVDLKAQYLSIKKEIDQAILDVIHESAFIGGRFVKSFEKKFANYVGSKHCIGVGNGTDAIYLALKALGISAGDEIITAANSFIATSEAVTLTGANVKFVDCDRNTYNIDPKKVEQAISKKTKAIIAVHLYGQPADMIMLKKIADSNGIFLLEDGAQAHGAQIEEQRVGTFGDLACFSFYPGKNLGAYGDAGAIVTADENLAGKCRMIANHGRVEKYDHEFEGVNSRLDGLQAAILCVKLAHLEKWTEKRRAAAAIYGELLAESRAITPFEGQGFRHVYHLYVVRIKNRDTVRRTLEKQGISTGIHYPISLPMLRAYRYLGHSPKDFPISNRYSQEILSLPMYPELNPTQIEYICDQLRNVTQS